jgi:hypothetical protein
MDQAVVLIVAVAGVAGVLASLSIVRRWRPRKESPFAASTQGEGRCPKCGMGNQWNDRTCIACGAPLPG